MKWLNFIKNSLIGSFAMLILSGCSISKESFDCTYGKGVGCHSITEVNSMVNLGKLVGTNAINQVTTTKHATQPAQAEVVSSDQMLVKRVTEEHLRIWIAPHQDEHGHFHEASVIHTVLRSGFWQIT